MPRPSTQSLIDLTGQATLSAAFERLRPQLLAMLNHRVSTKLALRIDPEGVINEAYLRAHKRWQLLLTKPTDLEGWVRGQVHDQYVDSIRKALGAGQDINLEVPLPDGSASPLAECLADSCTSAGAGLTREERRDVVLAALDRLQPLDRSILTLKFFEDLDYAEIGAILGISQNNANKRALAALEELRDLIPAAYRLPGESHS